MKRNDLLKKLKDEEFNLEMNLISADVDMTDEQYEYQKGRLGRLKAEIKELEMEDEDEER